MIVALLQMISKVLFFEKKREFLNDALEIHSSCLPKDIGIISHVIISLTM